MQLLCSLQPLSLTYRFNISFRQETWVYITTKSIAGCITADSASHAFVDTAVYTCTMSSVKPAVSRDYGVQSLQCADTICIYLLMSEKKSKELPGTGKG